jgi:staphylococcal nuclease domain-containing protein 1
MFVHSGDSISIQKKPGEEFIRIFLSNLKAPALARFGTDEQNKPWAFQSREFVRKKLVGKNVKCDLDYIHTINVDTSKTKEESNKPSKRVMKFYTVYYQNDKNETECINIDLIKNGLANLTNYKIEEGNPSKEFDLMLKAEQEAKNNKIGLFSPKAPPLCTYSDLLSSGRTKKKEFINFLTGLSHLNCMVDFCFSANKFKLRIDEKQVFIPFGLIGVKSFTNDKNNSSLFQKYFKISHEFVVNTILQRDGICDIVQADKVGNYFGNFIFEGKNFGTILIEKGLAVLNERSSDLGKNKYINEMREAEKKAQKEKIGLWEDEGVAKLLKGDSFNEGLSSDTKFEEINKDVKIRITDQIDFHKFYCNFLPNKTLEKIEDILADYDDGIKEAEKLSLPIKNGTLCAAKFPDDKKYYRGLVKRFFKDKNEFEIEFIDYGNIEKVKLNDLIKLDGKISSLPPQAMFCEFAYLKYSKLTMKKAVDKYPDFVDFDNEVNAKLCYTYNTDAEKKHGLIVFKEGKDLKKSYHADLLKLGYAKLNRNKELPEYMKAFDPIEKDAEYKELGVWDDNEETDYDQNDEDM